MMAPLVAWLLSVSLLWTGSAVGQHQSPVVVSPLRRSSGPAGPRGAIQQQQTHGPLLQVPPRYHPEPEQDPRYQQQQQVKLEQDGPPPGDATFQFHRLPMFRHVPRPVVPPGLFRPVRGKRPLPDALTSLLFPPEALPTPPPAGKPQQPTVEVWCGDDKVFVRVDRFRLGSWASPALFRLGSCSFSEVTPRFLYFNHKLAECQGTFTTVNGPLEYRNSLVFAPPPQDHVVRAVALDLPIYCHYNRFHYSYKVGYRPQADPKAYLKSIRTKRSFSLTVCDDQWQPLLPDQSFTLGGTVNFVAQTGYLMAGERLYVDSCYISASRDPNYSNTPSLDVITQFGCMGDSMRQGSNSRFWPGEGNVVMFSVDAFMFPGVTQQLLYLHCSMSVGSTPSASSKLCTFNTSTSRWEELEAPPSVCSCCDSVCREKQTWPSSVSPAVRRLISSKGWTVKEETADGQQSGDTTRTTTPPHQAEDPWRAETTGEKDLMKYKGLNIPLKSELIPKEQVISGASSLLYSVGEEEEEEWKKIRRGGAEEETNRQFEVDNAAHVKMAAMSQDNRRDRHPGLMDQDAEATGTSAAAGLSSHTSDATPTATSTVRYAPAYKATELVYRFDTSSVTSTPGLSSTSDTTSTTATTVQYVPAYKATELVYRFDTSSVASTPGLRSTSTSSVSPTSTPSFANSNVTTAMTAIAGPSSTSHSTPNSNGTRFDNGVSIGTVNVEKALVPNVTLVAQSDPGTTVLGSDQASEGHMSEAVSGLKLLASSTGSKTITTTADIRPAETRRSSGFEDLDWASLLELGPSRPVEGIPDNAPGLQLGRSGTRAGPDGFDESLWTKESEWSTVPTETSSSTSRFKVASSDSSVRTRWPESDDVSSEEAVSEVLVSGTGLVHAGLVSDQMEPQNLSHSSATVIVTTNVSQTHQSAGGNWFSDEERREGGGIMDSEAVERRENELGKEDKTGRGLWFKGMRRGRAKVLEQERFRSGPVSQWGGHRRPEQQEEVRRFLLRSKKPELWREDSEFGTPANTNFWNDPGMPENQDRVISGVLLEHTDAKSWNLE